MLTVEAKDIAVGDYSPDYGTVKEVVETKGKDQEVTSIKLIFINGKTMIMKPDDELTMTQGGRFDSWESRTAQ